MSQMLQSLLDIVGDPDREDLNSIREPMRASIQEIELEERKRLYDECFAIVKSTSREDSKRYYSHFIVFQHLSKATRRPKPLTKNSSTNWSSFSEKLQLEMANRRSHLHLKRCSLDIPLKPC